MKSADVPTMHLPDLGAPNQTTARADRPETFALLGRVAGCAWFLMLTLAYARPLFTLLNAAGSGGVVLVDWVQILSRICSLIFLVTLGWLMLVRATPVARNDGPIPVIMSFAATYAVWVVGLLPEAAVSAPIAGLSAILTLSGSALIVLVIGFLGRSFSIAPQARVLITGGPYRFVRHPLYAAEEIAVIGVLMHVVWYAAIPFLAVHLAMQLCRMRYEESLLRSVFPEYDLYAQRTARLFPGVW
jgi:protein-S-isoprenylcysteine O-methyltransferase Ste14